MALVKPPSSEVHRDGWQMEILMDANVMRSEYCECLDGGTWLRRGQLPEAIFGEFEEREIGFSKRFLINRYCSFMSSLIVMMLNVVNVIY